MLLKTRKLFSEFHSQPTKKKKSISVLTHPLKCEYLPTKKENVFYWKLENILCWNKRSLIWVWRVSLFCLHWHVLLGPKFGWHVYRMGFMSGKGLRKSITGHIILYPLLCTYISFTVSIYIMTKIQKFWHPNN